MENTAKKFFVKLNDLWGTVQIEKNMDGKVFSLIKKKNNIYLKYNEGFRVESPKHILVGANMLTTALAIENLSNLWVGGEVLEEKHRDSYSNHRFIKPINPSKLKKKR